MMGGATTFMMLSCTRRFRDNNPITYKALLLVLKDAVALFNKDKRAAAEIYVNTVGGKETVDEILESLNDPKNIITTTSQNTLNTRTSCARLARSRLAPVPGRISSSRTRTTCPAAKPAAFQTPQANEGLVGNFHICSMSHSRKLALAPRLVCTWGSTGCEATTLRRALSSV